MKEVTQSLTLSASIFNEMQEDTCTMMDIETNNSTEAYPFVMEIPL